jgi:hypothetical protein
MQRPSWGLSTQNLYLEFNDRGIVTPCSLRSQTFKHTTAMFTGDHNEHDLYTTWWNVLVSRYTDAASLHTLIKAAPQSYNFTMA